ncbi:Mucolipin-2 [Camelus dromedarius]|uniref:Mucolipin-2 n=1 Tax=Camelus dromedarius TaxID=9838 RepID=A0A5N4DDV9_CAMDR|nr:Mucolipin-2 [Camelus dromedarius]
MAHLDSEVKEECLREDLKFYFMNPCEKFRARQQIPWKLCLQILKIVMVTTQLVRFGLSNQLVVAFKEENAAAFKHLFLKGYSGTDEDDYSCSVYTQEDAYESIFFAINQASILNGGHSKYHRLRNISLGTLGYGESEGNRIGLKVCKQHYKKGTMFPSNETLNIDSDIKIVGVYQHTAVVPMLPRTLSSRGGDGLLQVEISFQLKGIDLQTIHSRELPDCYVFQNTARRVKESGDEDISMRIVVFGSVRCLDAADALSRADRACRSYFLLSRNLFIYLCLQITFDNNAHSGKIKIYFDSDANIEECKDLTISGSIQKNTQYVLVFDAFVIVICLASLILCTRSIVLALRLRKRFLNFFLEKYKRQVCDADQWEFVNGWYVLVITSDLMTVIGSVLKMEIKAKNLTNYNLCSILLGTSTLFVWVGVIRYLGYFQAYNVLILTMQASLPKVLRFCACAGMIYLGYTFCGWIVLGPYHNKFQNLNTVAECLFSLVNGDDMYATFAHIQQKSLLVWLFSRLYLYSFISLFIYMILSLFIALITDSYDTIKKYQQNGFPVTDLQEFLKESSSKEKCQKESSAFLSRVCCLRSAGGKSAVLTATETALSKGDRGWTAPQNCQKHAVKLQIISRSDDHLILVN